MCLGSRDAPDAKRKQGGRQKPPSQPMCCVVQHQPSTAPLGTPPPRPRQMKYPSACQNPRYVPVGRQKPTREPAPHLSQFLNVPHSSPPQCSGWTTNPPIHVWRIPSSKGEHAHTPGSPNWHTHSALTPSPRPTSSDPWAAACTTPGRAKGKLRTQCGTQGLKPETALRHMSARPGPGGPIRRGAPPPSPPSVLCSWQFGSQSTPPQPPMTLLDVVAALLPCHY